MIFELLSIFIAFIVLPYTVAEGFSDFSNRPCELGFPRSNELYVLENNDSDILNILIYIMCRFDAANIVALGTESVNANINLHPQSFPQLANTGNSTVFGTDMLPKEEFTEDTVNTVYTVHGEFTLAAHAFRMDKGQSFADIFGADDYTTRFFQFSLDLYTNTTERLVDSFHVQFRVARPAMSSGAVQRSLDDAVCTGGTTTPKSGCQLPSSIALSRDIDYLEIGTSDFDTLVQTAHAMNTLAAAAPSAAGENPAISAPFMGISVEPVHHYVSKLPSSEHLATIEAALGSRSGYLGVYAFNPLHLGADVNKLRGCSAVDSVHTAAKTVLSRSPHTSTLIVERYVTPVLTVGELYAKTGLRRPLYMKIDAEGLDFTIALETLSFLDRFSLPHPCMIGLESNAREHYPQIQTKGGGPDVYARLVMQLQSYGTYALFDVHYREEDNTDEDTVSNSGLFALRQAPECKAKWGRIAALLQKAEASLLSFGEETYSTAVHNVVIINATIPSTSSA